jgi:hypothetical protein
VKVILHILFLKLLINIFILKTEKIKGRMKSVNEGAFEIAIRRQKNAILN